MPPAGRDLGKRLENKSPVLNPRVRESELLRCQLLAADVEKVDVDDPGAVAKRGRPPQSGLDRLDLVEDLARRKGRENLRRGV